MLLPFLMLALAAAIFFGARMLSWKKPLWPWQEYKPQHPVVIVSVMLENQGKLLLGKRKGKSDSTGGLLSTPGGRVEYHETLKHAAARELHEETGLLLMPGEIDVLGFKEHPNRYNGHYVTFYMTARFASCAGQPVNREPNKCEGWQWYELDEFEHSDCTEPTSVLMAWRAYWRARNVSV